MIRAGYLDRGNLRRRPRLKGDGTPKRKPKTDSESVLILPLKLDSVYDPSRIPLRK